MLGLVKTSIYLSAKRLDTIYPKWHDRVDTKILDMSNFNCILGQIGGNSLYNTKEDFLQAATKFYGYIPYPQFFSLMTNVCHWVDRKPCPRALIAILPILIIAMPMELMVAHMFLMGKDHWIREINKRRDADARRDKVHLPSVHAVYDHVAKETTAV